jgi:hypothetical protein
MKRKCESNTATLSRRLDSTTETGIGAYAGCELRVSAELIALVGPAMQPMNIAFLGHQIRNPPLQCSKAIM